MKLSEQLKAGWNIFDAVEAVKNWRALLLLLAGMAVAGLFLTVGMKTEKTFFLFFSMLLAAAIAIYCWNAVGIMLCDDAATGRKTKISEALLRSASCGHRLILLLLICMAVHTIAALLTGILFLLDKIPGIGPFFSFIIMPVSSVVVGILWLLCTFIVLPLGSVSVWNGDPLERVFSNILALIRHCTMSILVRESFLVLFTFLVGGIIFACLFIGNITSASMAAIVHVAGGCGLLGGNGGGLPGDAGGFLGGDGGLLGNAFPFLRLLAGQFLLFLIASLIPALIMAEGVCLIYLSSIRGLDSAESAAEFHAGMAGVRNRFADARRAAEKAAAEARAQAPAPQPQAQAPEPPVKPAPGRRCPYCNGELEEDDVFCPSCGKKVG